MAQHRYLRRLPTSLADSLFLPVVYTRETISTHSAVFLGHTKILYHLTRKGLPIPGLERGWLHVRETARWAMWNRYDSYFAVYIGTQGDMELLRELMRMAVNSSFAAIFGMIVDQSLWCGHYDTAKAALPFASGNDDRLIHKVARFGTGELVKLIPGIDRIPIKKEYLFKAIMEMNLSTLISLLDIMLDRGISSDEVINISQGTFIHYFEGETQFAQGWREYVSSLRERKTA